MDIFPFIQSLKRDKKMRSIQGLLQGDITSVSSKLTPEVAGSTVCPVSGADAHVLTVIDSPNQRRSVFVQRSK
jgi:hypothetical protein